jgi:mRNA deadenylase 3'-5' endonuclease subunit Ccr4
MSSSLEQEIFLQWGNKKRLRCLRAKAKKISRSKNSSRFLGQDTVLLQSSRFSRGSEGAILRSGLPDRRRPSPEKEERYYTTRGVVDNIGKDCLDGNINGEDSNNKEESMWPKLFITLSNKEKEEDFMAMKGCKPSHRPKKRAKLIQRSLLVSFPYSFLSFLEKCSEDSSVVCL